MTEDRNQENPSEERYPDIIEQSKKGIRLEHIPGWSGFDDIDEFEKAIVSLFDYWVVDVKHFDQRTKRLIEAAYADLLKLSFGSDGVSSIDVDEESRTLTIETDIEFIDTILVCDPVAHLFPEYEKVFSDILFWVDEE
jgi:hypothetical protein